MALATWSAAKATPDRLWQRNGSKCCTVWRSPNAALSYRCWRPSRWVGRRDGYPYPPI